MLHKIIIIFTICTSMSLAYSDGGEEVQLVTALKDKPFREVIRLLQNGQLSPPCFLINSHYDVRCNNTVPLFLRSIESSRQQTLEKHYNNSEYTADIITAYEYFDNYHSYEGAVLCDVLKRCLLEWAQQQIASGSGEVVCNRVSKSMRRVILRPSALSCLIGDKDNTITESVIAATNIENAAQLLWKSYGYTEVSDGYTGIAQAMRENRASLNIATSELAGGYKPMQLALRMFVTEGIRAVSLNGTLEFLNKKGNVALVDISNVGYFYQIMPLQECGKYQFLPIARTAFSPFALLTFIGIPQSKAKTSFSAAACPYWMEQVFK